MAAKSLPRRLIYRPKRGFDLPIDQWLRGTLRERLEGFLSESAIDSINYVEARSIFSEFLKGDKKQIAMCWLILTLEQWYRNFIKAQGVHPGSYGHLKCPESLREDGLEKSRPVRIC
jgi:asparagine synthase (glutamine-hydrolysing)